MPLNCVGFASSESDESSDSDESKPTQPSGTEPQPRTRELHPHTYHKVNPLDNVKKIPAALTAALSNIEIPLGDHNVIAHDPATTIRRQLAEELGKPDLNT